MGRETLSFVLLPLSVLGQIVNWDRSHPSHAVTSLNNSSQSINAFLQTYGMVDPWSLDTRLLVDEEFVQLINTQIDFS